MTLPAVETGIPIPPLRAPKHAYGLDRLELLQSILVDLPLATVASQASKVGKKLGRRFTTRSVEGGVRVWRVA